LLKRARIAANFQIFSRKSSVLGTLLDFFFKSIKRDYNDS
jgi:hypothetical protein